MPPGCVACCCPLRGCVAPLLVLVRTSSKGPLMLRLKVKSAFESLVKVSF